MAEYPVALTSMIIVTIAGGPGRPMGACFQGAAYAVAGVLLGSAVFAILAKLASVPVAQAVVFAVFVYGKPLSSRIHSLIFGDNSNVCNQDFRPKILCVLPAVNPHGIQRRELRVSSMYTGLTETQIYTSQLLEGVFSPAYLLSYLKGYAWGVAIVLAVNILVFPRTSERELRQAIVTSLEHLATFAALIGKAYTLTGTEEDKAARELLSQTIKADFQFMTQKIEET